MKQNIYEVEKNVEKILRGKATGFLTSNVRLAIQNRLKKKEYNVFLPFKEAEKVILYADVTPKVHLFQICCYKDDELRHSSIMGSLFGLNITSEMFGDIVKWQNSFYVYLTDDVSELVVQELKFIGSIPVCLKEVPIELLSEFDRTYEKIELIVSSLRTDTVIAKLIGCNRDEIYNKIRDKEIFINEIPVKRASNLLCVGDVFSIRKYGKFIFREIIGETKKGNLIVDIDKYI